MMGSPVRVRASAPLKALQSQGFLSVGARSALSRGNRRGARTRTEDTSVIDPIDPSEEVQTEELRFQRAVGWARGRSLGQRDMGLSEVECRRIEALRDQVVELVTRGSPPPPVATETVLQSLFTLLARPTAQTPSRSESCLSEIRYLRGGGSEVDIDHVVALGDAWQKRAQHWAYGKRVAFATDPLNLARRVGISQPAQGA